jgi:hypothetical protein
MNRCKIIVKNKSHFSKIRDCLIRIHSSDKLIKNKIFKKEYESPRIEEYEIDAIWALHYELYLNRVVQRKQIIERGGDTLYF